MGITQFKRRGTIYRMNIGIDVDGVLCDLENFQYTHIKKYFHNKYDVSNLNEFFDDVKDILGCSEKERKKFWKKYAWKYALIEPARENAPTVIRKLHEEGHKIYIITARAFVTEKNFIGKLSRGMLMNWLERKKIHFDEIHFCSDKHSARDKVEGCKKFSIDVMIEDIPENIKEVSEFSKVLCFAAGYNRDCIGDNIIRVSSWDEIYEEIEKLAVLA